MILTPKYKLFIGIGAVVLLAVLAFATQDVWKPLPEMTTYHDNGFSFEYPRVNNAEEYAPGAVIVGTAGDEGLSPLVEVIRYQSDPDTALPATFDAYVRKQALALCGSDGSVERLSCTDVVATPYTSAQGLEGQELSLTLVRTNLADGTTATETFAPIYVFNTTRPVEDAEDRFRYRAVFVYPSFASVISGTASPALLAQIIDSLLIPGGVSDIVSR